MQLSGKSDTTVVVELLDKSDKPLKQVRASEGVAEFFYLSPGSYYMRAFVDRNGNGRWDTGSYDEDLQAEEVYYYPKAIECKEKFDVTLPWNLTGTPMNLQKPDKEQQKLRNRNAERAKQLGIEYVKRDNVKIEKE